MGNEVSIQEAGRDGVAGMTSTEFINALADVCKGDHKDVFAVSRDLQAFKDLWRSIADKRLQDPTFDENLVKDNCMKYLKYAFRHSDSDWREVGVRLASTFFPLQLARDKLVASDFVGSMMLITMPDEEIVDVDDGQPDTHAERLESLQILAAETILEMADYAEFLDQLCSSSVLNFLCIVLNQVPTAVEIANQTFVKISKNPEKLGSFRDGAVSDILESFFKAVNFRRPDDGGVAQLEQWARDVSALSHCAHTMGTMIKYGYACQVDLPTIGEIFASMPQNVRLLAELARLFYWLCRISQDVFATLMEAAPAGGGPEGLETLLHALVKIWNKVVDTYRKLSVRGSAEDRALLLGDFLVNDLDSAQRIQIDSDEFHEKVWYVQHQLCYMNCLIWVLLPERAVRWKLRDFGLKDLYCGFELRDEEMLKVILGTVRHLLDLPEVQHCHELTKFFGEQLLILVEFSIKGEIDDSLVALILDGVCILAMQRSLQTMLAELDIWDKLNKLIHRWEDYNIEPSRIKQLKISSLRTFAQVACNPAFRLTWLAQEEYPPRLEFEDKLDVWLRSDDENFRTSASLLLNIFQERKFHRELKDVETAFSTVLDWWHANSTMRYEDHREAADIMSASGGSPPVDRTVPASSLEQQLQLCMRRIEERQALTSMASLQYCAPYESILALCLLSRLALEPKFKPFFFENALDSLLGCICVGIWAEAREAAAALANLMWLPDLKEENLICWLKFDGPRCITVDAANVLLPVRSGSPKPVDLGKGMYQSTWGIEFVQGSRVLLHPSGLVPYMVPALLTTASPADTFQATAQSYNWLGEPLEQKHFTLTCWFYWPLPKPAGQSSVCCLVQSAPPKRHMQIYVEFQGESKEGVWTIVDQHGTTRTIATPKINPGWHLLTLVSSTEDSVQEWDGIKFYIDTWSYPMKNVWIDNNFLVVGNDASDDGRKPFGLIADFRIYARVLPQEEIESMVNPESAFPDTIVSHLANLDAATILAQRLDVPDTAVECLRALGSLATLSSQRAKIFNVCGRKVLELLDSPLPMVQRQAARLLNNLT